MGEATQHLSARPVARHIAVGRDQVGWHERFASALAARAVTRPELTFEVVDLEAHDWIDAVAGASDVVWNPSYMGPVSASMFKEKVLFLEEYLHKRVMPNYESVWHFESKIAQSYILDKLDVPRPRTVVSFEYEDAVRSAEALGLPVVAKKSFGASSENVVLLRKQASLRRYLETAFAQQIWDEHKRERGSALGAATAAPASPWMREKVRRKVAHAERVGSVYLQEFVEGNDSDLRVTVVGTRAVAFWRRNRPGDFRASGSGLIDYEHPVPGEVVRFCVELSRTMGFDSMAYDILFRGDEFLVVEMSYNYLDTAVHDAPTTWTCEPGEDAVNRTGHVWPEEMWIDRLLGGLDPS